MRKLYSLAVGCLLLGATQGAFAYGNTAYGNNAYGNNYDSCCNPCDPCADSCDFHGEVYADFLYWQACRSDLIYQTGTVDPTEYHFGPGYGYGWRVGGALISDCWDIGARYTGFTDDNRENLVGVTIPDTYIAYDIDWHVVDIELASRMPFCCDKGLLRPFVGAKLAWLEENRELLLVGADLFRDRLEYDAYGIYTGLEAKYQFWSTDWCGSCIPFSLVGRGSIGILHAQVDESIYVGDLEIGDRHQGCFYPIVLEAFVGVEIGGSDIGCVSPYLRVGYETQTWQVLGFATGATETNLEQLSQLGFGGLTLRLGVGF